MKQIYDKDNIRYSLILMKLLLIIHSISYINYLLIISDHSSSSDYFVPHSSFKLILLGLLREIKSYSHSHLNHQIGKIRKGKLKKMQIKLCGHEFIVSG